MAQVVETADAEIAETLPRSLRWLHHDDEWRLIQRGQGQLLNVARSDLMDERHTGGPGWRPGGFWLQTRPRSHVRVAGIKDTMDIYVNRFTLGIEIRNRGGAIRKVSLRLGWDNLGRIDAALDGVPVRAGVPYRREIAPPRDGWSASCRQEDDRLRLRVAGPQTDAFAIFRCTVHGPFGTTWHEFDRSSGAYLANLQLRSQETYLWPVQFEPVQASYSLPTVASASAEARNR